MGLLRVSTTQILETGFYFQLPEVFLLQLGRPTTAIRNLVSSTLTIVLGIADVNLSSLSAASGSPQWLLLLFIPMAWTFVCPTEIIAFSDSFQVFQSRGCNVAFASTDSEYSLYSWSTTPRKM